MTNSEIEQLREELANCHESLDQWTKAEVEWSQQRRLFQIMTENVTDLIVLLDHQGHRTWNNPAYSHLMGYYARRIGRDSDALAQVHPGRQGARERGA